MVAIPPTSAQLGPTEVCDGLPVACPARPVQLGPTGGRASPTLRSWALEVAVWAARPHCHQSGLRTQEGSRPPPVRPRRPPPHRARIAARHDPHARTTTATLTTQTPGSKRGGITTIGPRHADDTPPRASYGRNSPHRYITTKVARNFPRSFFETARKRCNSNVLNSMFEILAGELRATLLGNHSDISTEEAADAQNTSGATGKAKHQTEDTTGKAERHAAPTRRASERLAALR